MSDAGDLDSHSGSDDDWDDTPYDDPESDAVDSDAEEDQDAEEDEEEEEDDPDKERPSPVVDDAIKDPKRRVKPLDHKPTLYSQILTRYEKTALIGYRAQQIVSGATIYVKTYPDDSPFSIAERELKEKCLPYYIERRLPDGTVASVKIDDLLDLS